MSTIPRWGAALAVALLLTLAACSRLPGLSTPVALQPTAAPTALPTRAPAAAPTRRGCLNEY